MVIILTILFVLSCIYCCDEPAWTGFEFLINDHNSLLYTIGVSIIPSYVFYLFQEIIPNVLQLGRKRKIAFDRLDKIEYTMFQTLCCLQGELPNKGVQFSVNLIKCHLEKINIFVENSNEIQQHNELSVFEALVHYDNKIMNFADELIAGKYFGIKHEKTLFNIKLLKLHNAIMCWNDNLPGEYKRYNQSIPGYNGVNLKSVNSHIVSCIEEYIKIYKDIKNLQEKRYKGIYKFFSV